MNRAFRFAVEHYLFVPAATVVAVVLANTVPDTYFRMAQALSFLVNEVGMAFVLGFIAQEVLEATLPGGTLAPLRSAVLPVVAALTGVLGAATVYVLYILSGDTQNLLPGWRAATAVDIGLCYAVVSSILGRGSARTFALLLAVASDAIGLLLVSNGYAGNETRPLALLLVILAIVIAVYIRRRGVRSVWPYLLVPGVLSWAGLHAAGIHPALALIPIVPFMPHTARHLAAPDRHEHERLSPPHFEEIARVPVQVISALFGLVNGGVMIHGFGDGTWAILAAALIGRPAGILIGAAAALGVGLHLPRGMRRGDLVVIAIAAAPAFTFGVFFATAVFPDGPLLTEVKLGAMASVAGSLIAFAFAFLRERGVRSGSALKTLRNERGDSE